MNRRTFRGLGLVLLLVLTACQVDVTVEMAVEEDGTGQVTVTVVLDEEAAAQVPDLAEQLRVDDLETAGWTVGGPEEADDGSEVLTAAKPFASLEEATSVLAEVAGVDGPFAGLTVTHDRSFARTEWELSGEVDLSEGVADIADEELAEVLGGDPFGGSLDQIEAETGAPVDEQVSLTLSVALPGGRETWTIEPGGDPQELSLTTTEVRPLPLVLLAAAALLVVVGLAIVVGRWIAARVRRRRERRGEVAPDEAAAPAVPTAAAPADLVASGGAVVTAPTEKPGPARAGEPVTAPAEKPGPARAGEPVTAPAQEPPAEPRAGEPVGEEPATPAGEPEGEEAATPAGEPEGEEAATPAGEPAGKAEPARKLRLVVLDVMGVVFESGSETEDLLVRFAADKGSPADRETVLRQYRRAAEGRITVGEFWSSLGLSDDPGDLSDEFLTAHRLRPGVRDFLERMRGRQLPVACVANDVAEWSRKLRLTHRLDPVTTAWLVSGDVGERMPGGALYGRVIQTTGIESGDAFFISDRRGHLDTARSFGFAAAWFRPDGPGEGEESPYPVITSFADLGVS